jgi:hypothetical protein
MISPNEEHKYLSKILNIDKIAHYNIFDKYIIENKKGADKIIDIEGSDQESIMQTKNGGYPVPGIIYTFIYKGDKLVIDIASKKSEFFDHVPLIFCMNTGQGYYTGLNLNMLPKDVRLKFLQAFYETFKDFFKNIELLTDNNKLAWNKKFVEFIKSGGSKKMLETFNKKTASNFGFAYRKYLIKDVKQLRMVEYSEWPYIPFYEPKNAFRGMNQSQIHKLYYKFKNI